jgi:hypothetical protein
VLDLNNAAKKPGPRNFEMKFRGLQDGIRGKKYPFMMYRDGADPLAVHDTAEEDEAYRNGYDPITAGQMANRNLVNWFWDLEDFSVKQLLVFAKDEYGVDLPAEASQEKLFAAVCKLTRAAPQNRNRIVLMAHTIKLNYDETLAEITRAMEHPAEGYEVQNEVMEFYA